MLIRLNLTFILHGELFIKNYIFSKKKVKIFSFFFNIFFEKNLKSQNWSFEPPQHLPRVNEAFFGEGVSSRSRVVPHKNFPFPSSKPPFGTSPLGSGFWHSKNFFNEEKFEVSKLIIFIEKNLKSENFIIFYKKNLKSQNWSF